MTLQRVHSKCKVYVPVPPGYIHVLYTCPAGTTLRFCSSQHIAACSLRVISLPFGLGLAISGSHRGIFGLDRVRMVGGSLATTRVRKIADRKSTRLNSSHLGISYAVFC